MPIRYEIDVARHLLRITAMGDVSIEEQRALNRAWATDPDYVPGMAILVDNRGRTLASTPGYVRAMASSSRRHARLFDETRCAVVVSRDVQFGMTRMYGLMSDGIPMQTQAFRSIEEAEAWLGLEPDSIASSTSEESAEIQALP